MDYLSSKDSKSLYKAILALNSEDECKKFLRDLLTEKEIKEFTNRWKVARMLDQKVPYEKIEKEIGMSSTTIARVNKWLTNGKGGYRLILTRLNTKKFNVLNTINDIYHYSAKQTMKIKNFKQEKNYHHTSLLLGGVIFSG